MAQWIKKGLIFSVDDNFWWAKTYAYLPTPYVLDSNKIRLYFASYDENLFGRIGFLELDIKTGEISYITENPVLDLGSAGLFDDSGVSPSCILDVGDKLFLYYFGWQRVEQVPYMLFCGLAVSTDGGRSFKKFSRVPILDRTDKEPFLRSAVTVLKEDNTYRMWYVSGLDWIELNGTKYPTYLIRYAESSDGIKWSRENPICIQFEDDSEFGFGRPWVIKEDGLYKMWYSIRSKARPYRIGYAESGNGIDWTRKDEEAGIDVSQSGWDSEMICFPSIIKLGHTKYMFYNGNQHGRTGFGLAELTD
ncbi:MAG TPA: hypothetical protein ENG51_02810 [Deltaproteobacteria bacterium]|nr:hypothetical protein [Deltaproteobacteria bacterium]